MLKSWSLVLSHWRNRCLVDHGVMLQAAREFFDTGTLPMCVVWEAEPSPATGNAAELVT